MNVEKVTVSVLMPTYNDARYLRDAIDSILLQSFKDFELIIVDDGSTDETKDVLAEYNDSKIRVITFPENRGRPAARNAAMDAATGKYIIWMDSDDISMPHRIEKQVEFLDANPDIIVCSGAVLSFFLQGLQWQPPQTEGAIRAELFWGNTIPNVAACMRRDAVAATGVRFDPNLPRAQDYDFWCRLLLDHTLRAVNLPDILLLYRRTKQTFQAAMHSYILKSHLRRLKLPVTAEMIEIFTFLAYRQETEKLCSPDTIVEWANTVVNANTAVAIFPKREFVVSVFDRAFSAALRSFPSRLSFLRYAIGKFPLWFIGRRVLLSAITRTSRALKKLILRSLREDWHG